MEVIAATAVLLQLGICDVRPCTVGDVDDVATLIADACHPARLGPRRFETPVMDGRTCVAVAATVWRLETKRTFSMYPPSGKYGCGVGQVIPLERWGNVRVGRHATPPCETLRIPRVGFRWLVRTLRAKLYRCKSWRCRLSAYNAHPKHRARYGRLGAKLLRRVGIR
jgi:hypothetical protein